VLTADLVNARRRGRELRLVPLDAGARRRALTYADALIAITAATVGRTRDELLAAMGAIDVGAREHRLRDGLAKLIEDRCAFDAGDDADPEAIRREVFSRASAARAALPPGVLLDRNAILADVAVERATSPDALERALFADLRGAHLLAAFDAPSAAALLAHYEHAQAAAVLLRAVRVTVDVRCATAGSLRALFRRLKFLRLLHTIERTDGGHRIVIDGPFSLFESVTKYGLQLALVLPALEQCDVWRLEADVRWGKERTVLSFRLSSDTCTANSAPFDTPPLPDEVETLARTFAALGTSWRVSTNTDILDLPGVGISIPDLVFDRIHDNPDMSDRVYLEVMGYWSRAAVWRRIELVEAGLPSRILFAVSSRLRVSEQALDETLPGALYVYKATMSARAIAERLDRLAGRDSPGAWVGR
jgi:predicted nuclease of restriction endonuclease-like RecB superfamily